MISFRRFVTVWTVCPSAEDAARELGIPTSKVLFRAAELRTAGVKLKPSFLSVRKFAKLWNKRPWQYIEDVQGFLGMSEATFHRYHARARRAGIRLRVLAEMPPA